MGCLTFDHAAVVWHSLYSERKRGMPVSLDSIEPLGNGICTAIMHSNESIQLGAFESLASPVIDSIEQLFALVKITSDESSPTKLLESIGEELRLLSCLIRTLSSSSHESGDEQMEEDENGHVAGNRSRRPSRRADVPAYALAVVRRCLPSIEVIASEYNDNVVSRFCSRGQQKVHMSYPFHCVSLERLFFSVRVFVRVYLPWI